MPGILLPSRKFYENTYTETVLATDPIAHWTLGERFGATAYDATPNHFNGTITGATLGRPGIGDGLTSMFFDGLTDFVDIWSPGFRDAFNGSEFHLRHFAFFGNHAPGKPEVRQIEKRLFLFQTQMIFKFLLHFIRVVGVEHDQVMKVLISLQADLCK